MVHDRLLDAEHWRQFRTLILPNIAALSDAQCDQIRSIRRARRQPRRDARNVAVRRVGRAAAGLRAGRSVRGIVRGRSRGPDAELVPEAREGSANGELHPLLAGLEDAARIINGANRVVMKPRGSERLFAVQRSFRRIRICRWKRCSRACRSTDDAGGLCSRSRDGARRLLPWDIDRTFWEVLVDRSRQATAQRMPCGQPTNRAPVAVEGPGLMDVTIWTQRGIGDDSSGQSDESNDDERSCPRVLPIGPLEVTVRVPELRKARAAKLLTAGGTAEAVRSGGELRLSVPKVELHEVVAFDL